MVGILVEEALMARVAFDHENSNKHIDKNLYSNETNKDKPSFNYNYLEELISDKGITYDTKKYNYNSDYILSKSKENFNEELFEQFKQFILFQKMIHDK